MNIYIAALLITASVSLLGYLWLSMVAFKRSIPWGLMVLLLSPITAIAFAVMYWYDARKAFVVYISAFLLCAGSAVMIIGNVGMGNMQQISTRMQSGQLAPAQAYQLVNNRLEHPGNADLFTDAGPEQLVNSGVAEGGASPAAAMTGAPQQGQSQVAMATKTDATAEAAKPQDTTAKMPLPVPATMDDVKPAQKSAESAPVKNEKEAPKQEPKQTAQTPKQDEVKKKIDKKTTKPKANVPLVKIAEPDPLAQKPYVPPPNTTRVSLSRISHFVGRYFIITLKDGVVRRGLLKQVTSTHLMLDRKLYGGNIRYKIRKTQVRKIRMLTRLPDER